MIRQLIEDNLNIPLVVKIDPDDVSIAGQIAIERYLHDEFRIPAPDYTFDWRLKNRRGTLAKRLSAWAYNKYSIKMTAKQKAHIGNTTDLYRLYRDAFYIQFDTGLFWHKGTFGDGDSCYWQTKDHMRAMLNGSASVYTLKIYNDEECQEPWGRSLLLMDVPDKESIVCINAYPKGFMVTNAGRILVKFAAMNELPMETRHIDTVYRGSWKDYIWINGGNAALVAPRGSTLLNSDKLEIANFVRFENCMVCKKQLMNACFLVGTKKQCIGYMCVTCANKYLDKCRFCGTQTFKKNMVYHDELAIYACNDCISRIRHCNRCGKPFFLYTNPCIPIWHTDTGSRSYGLYLPLLGYTCNDCISRYKDMMRQVPNPTKASYAYYYTTNGLYGCEDYTNSLMKQNLTVMKIRNYLYGHEDED